MTSILTFWKHSLCLSELLQSESTSLAAVVLGFPANCPTDEARAFLQKNNLVSALHMHG